jgi:GPH family glycoside/pentoside/hexuronide:cation symporter
MHLGQNQFMNEFHDYSEIKFSTKVHASYALGSFFDDFLATALSFMVFKFYETEIFLNITLITIVVVIYGVWNMFNDPLAGHISNLNIEFMKKRGKRFTWFFLTGIPTSIIFVLIFLPPTGNEVNIFLWLLFTLCILDTFFSFMIISYQSIYPDKFRSQKERTKVAGFQILYSLFGLTFGTLLPTLIISTGSPGTNISSYITVGLIVTIVCTIIVILMIYGMRENREMIDRTFIINEDQMPKENYFRKLSVALKQKNYISYLLAYLAQTTVMVLMLASVPYWVQYVIKIDPIYEIVILLAFLFSSVLSAPFWIFIARKFGNRIGYMCGTGGTATFLILTLFIWDFPLVIFGFILIGFSMGATWTLIYATFSDVIDEIVIKTRKREEGIYYGFRTFIGRLSIVIQALTIGIIHLLTSFDPRASNQLIEAQWGINVGMFAVPALFYLIGFFFMWKIYDLKPKKVAENKNKLKELKL